MIESEVANNYDYIIRALSHNLPIKDEEFDKLYSSEMQVKSARHWTPIDVAKKAAEFLVTKPGIKVLDLGSGVGKFCIVGSLLAKEGHFYGVEQRKNLFDISNSVVKKYNLKNITFLHSNITTIDLSKYDAFYFYNSFYENIEPTSKIDNDVIVSLEKYIKYRNYLLSHFAKAPIGTRIVTYSGFNSEIPPGYKLFKSEKNYELKFWIKDSTISI